MVVVASSSENGDDINGSGKPSGEEEEDAVTSSELTRDYSALSRLGRARARFWTRALPLVQKVPFVGWLVALVRVALLAMGAPERVAKALQRACRDALNRVRADLQGHLLIVASAGFIGWFTNWLAVKMIFCPLEFRGFWQFPGSPAGLLGWQVSSLVVCTRFGACLASGCSRKTSHLLMLSLLLGAGHRANQGGRDEWANRGHGHFAAHGCVRGL